MVDFLHVSRSSFGCPGAASEVHSSGGPRSASRSQASRLFLCDPSFIFKQGCQVSSAAGKRWLDTSATSITVRNASSILSLLPLSCPWKRLAFFITAFEF